jgi:hypothetical protein
MRIPTISKQTFSIPFIAASVGTTFGKEAASATPTVAVLDWAPCGSDFPGIEWAAAAVPLDYGQPDAGTTGVALARVPATDARRAGRPRIRRAVEIFGWFAALVSSSCHALADSEPGPAPQDAGAAAPAPVCTHWLVCRDWSFGPGAPSTQTETFRHRVTTCRDRGCFDACEEEVESIQAAQEALRDQVPEQYRDEVTIARQAEVGVSSRRYNPGLPEDDRFDEIRECTVTFEYPTPELGQGFVCGCEAFECWSPGCGLEVYELTSPVDLPVEVSRAWSPELADGGAARHQRSR